MASFKQFMKQNQKKRENVKHAVTKLLCDDNGKPLEWEIQPISSKRDEELREACTKEVPVVGKRGQTRQKFNTNEYLSKLMTESVVFPDLYNAELQDSYGVKTPEELLKAMVPDLGEYNRFAEFVQSFNGFDDTLETKVDEAKN